MTDALKHDIAEDLFADWGLDRFAYVKSISSDDFAKAFPDAPPIPSGVSLFALVAANGAPIMLTDRREEAITNAWDNDLETVSLH